MKILTTIALVIFTATSVPSVAAQESMAEDRQEQHKLSQTAKERLVEQKGGAVIYDGLHEIVADQTLDNQFNRTGSTRLVQTEYTDPDSQTLPDDDCD